MGAYLEYLSRARIFFYDICKKLLLDFQNKIV